MLKDNINKSSTILDFGQCWVDQKLNWLTSVLEAYIKKIKILYRSHSGVSNN